MCTFLCCMLSLPERKIWSGTFWFGKSHRILQELGSQELCDFYYCYNHFYYYYYYYYIIMCCGSRYSELVLDMSAFNAILLLLLLLLLSCAVVPGIQGMCECWMLAFSMINNIIIIMYCGSRYSGHDCVLDMSVFNVIIIIIIIIIIVIISSSSIIIIITASLA